MPVPSVEPQLLTPGALISLYDLDLTPIGGGVFRFVPGAVGDAKVKWRGLTYEPVPVGVEGFEKQGTGQQPTPTVTLPATPLIVSASLSFDDMRGARVVRWQTHRQFLDDQPTASAAIHYEPEVYYVERKIRHNTVEGVIEWELSNPLDLHEVQVPQRVATQTTCMWRYRFWNGVRFDNAKATCIYAGARMFDVNGNPTSDPAKDRCGKKLEDCRKRFGSGNPLYFGGFPSMSRSR